MSAVCSVHSAKASDHPSPMPPASLVCRHLVRAARFQSNVGSDMDYSPSSTTSSEAVRQSVCVLVSDDVVLKSTVALRLESHYMTEIQYSELMTYIGLIPKVRYQFPE